MPNLLDVQNLEVDFERNNRLLYAVRNVSFSLQKGELLGIVGESGSGKSVTASSILRLLPDNAAQSGNLLFDGEEIPFRDKKALREFRGSKVAMIFQEPGRSFDPIYSIGKTFEETLKIRFGKMDENAIREKTLSLLNEVGIPEPENRLGNFPHQFSGGQLQRIMIALALACEPDILIADEPTTALDVTIQAEIVRLILSLRKSRNLAIIFITHDIDLVAGIADRILVMYGGKVMEEGPAEAVMNRPHHPYSRSLLQAIPRFGSHYEQSRLTTIPGTVPDPFKPEPGCPFAPRCPYSAAECTTAMPDEKQAETRYSCILEELP